jgi:hypothetical protein
MNKISDEIKEDVNEFKKGVDILKVHRRYIYVIVGIVVLAICLFVFQDCQHKNQVNSLVKDIATYSDSAEHYKSKYGVVAFNQTLKFGSEEQLKSYLSNNDTLKDLLRKFKKLNSVTVVTQKIYIHDTVPIMFETKIPCDFKPFAVIKDSSRSKTKPFYFKGTIFPEKFTLDSILVPNKQTIVVGTKRINLFKKEERAEIVNSNSLISVSNVGAYTVVNKKKWFQRPVPMLIGGVIIGGTAVTIKNLGKK